MNEFSLNWLRDALQEMGYFVHYHEFSGGHDYISWRGSLTDGVLSLVGPSKAQN